MNSQRSTVVISKKLNRSFGLAVLALGVSLVSALTFAVDDALSASSQAQSASSKIRLQLNWVPEPEFGGMYAALQDGLFTKAGLDVELIKGAAGTPAPQMAASGQVEFAIASADQILTLNEKGGGLVAVFSIFETSPMGVMVKSDATWKSLEELWKSDATVAMESGLPYLKFLNRTFAGGKVKIVPTGAGLAAFERGVVQGQQCFISAEPVQMELKQIPVRVFSLAASGYNPYVATVVTKSEWLSEHRTEATKFVQALREGWRRYQADPGKYNLAISKLNPAMSKEAMDIAANKQRDLVAAPAGGATEIGMMTRERWVTLVAQLQELKTISKGPDSIDAVFWNAPK